MTSEIPLEFQQFVDAGGLYWGKRSPSPGDPLTPKTHVGRIGNPSYG